MKAKNFTAYLINVSWDDASDDVVVNEFASQAITNIENAAKASNLYYPFQYLNDASGSEEIFNLYGGGKSLPKLQAIAKRYGASFYLLLYRYVCLISDELSSRSRRGISEAHARWV